MRADPGLIRHHRHAMPCQGKLRSGSVCPHSTNYQCTRCRLELCGRHAPNHWCELPGGES